jgi:SWI/SNF-related matrix-associated actin-dependent regulator of chromatin subfamily A-like protein 1
MVLGETIMIRRTKDQVLSELPRKIRQQVFLKVSQKDLKELALSTETIVQAIDDGTLDGLLKKSEYMALWKRTGEIKLQAMLDYVEDLLEGQSKILLFAHHLSILDSFENAFYEKVFKF